MKTRFLLYFILEKDWEDIKKLPGKTYNYYQFSEINFYIDHEILIYRI